MIGRKEAKQFIQADAILSKAAKKDTPIRLLLESELYKNVQQIVVSSAHIKEPLHQFTATIHTDGGDDNKQIDVHVRIYRTQEEMLEAYAEHCKDIGKDNDATFITKAITENYIRRIGDEVQPDIARIWLSKDAIGARVITHEVTHAAMAAYSHHFVKEGDTADQHINGANEDIAYIVGDLCGVIINKMYKLGIY